MVGPAPTTLATISQRLTDKVGDGNFINPTQAQITDVVNQTIKLYQDKPFWFSEHNEIITLVPGSKYVPVLEIPDNFKQSIMPNSMVVLVEQVRYTLSYIKPIAYDLMDVGGTGIPYWYTYRDGATDPSGGFQLYPYPDQDYPLYMYYRIYYDLLENPDDTNDMLKYADLLIEAKALATLLRDYRSAPDRASEYDGGPEQGFRGGLAKAYLSSILNETYNRNSSGNLTTENIINDEDIYNF